MTMIHRSAPEAALDMVFATLELRLLDTLVKDRTGTRNKTLSTYLGKLAQLADISPGAPILHPATWLCGGAFRASPTSSWEQPLELNLWAIERIC